MRRTLWGAIFKMVVLRVLAASMLYGLIWLKIAIWTRNRIHVWSTLAYNAVCNFLTIASCWLLLHTLLSACNTAARFDQLPCEAPIRKILRCLVSDHLSDCHNQFHAQLVLDRARRWRSIKARLYQFFLLVEAYIRSLDPGYFTTNISSFKCDPPAQKLP